MLSIFRTNQVLVSILQLFYVGVLHLSTLFLGEGGWTPATSGFAADVIYDLTGYTGWLPQLITVLLLFFQAAIINVLVLDNRLGSELSLFPGLFYLLVVSLLPEFLHFSPLHMANLFLLLGLGNLLATYNRPKSPERIFNFGWWIGIASLFYPIYLLFVLFGFMGLSILRAFRFRERLMIVSGALTPYILLGVGLFWFDRFDPFFRQQFQEGFAWLDLNFQQFRPMIYFRLGLIGLLLFVLLFSHGQYLSKKIMQVQKKIDVLFWGLLVGGLTVFFQPSPGLDHLLVLGIPMGILLSLNFIDLSPKWAELLHLLLLATALLLQFLPLLGWEWASL